MLHFHGTLACLRDLIDELTLALGVDAVVTCTEDAEPVRERGCDVRWHPGFVLGGRREIGREFARAVEMGWKARFNYVATYSTDKDPELKKLPEKPRLKKGNPRKPRPENATSYDRTTMTCVLDCECGVSETVGLHEGESRRLVCDGKWRLSVHDKPLCPTCWKEGKR